MGDGGSQEQIESKIEKTQLVVEEVERQFKNPDLTTFVCVCIPEFLSLYETGPCPRVWLSVFRLCGAFLSVHAFTF